MSEAVTVFGLGILYRICILLVGLLFAYMGFRLFMADKVGAAGDFEASNGSYALSLKGGAPGVFFCLFGTILIFTSILKGVEYDNTKGSPGRDAPVTKIISDEPPV
jgi:hypothetical protein